MVSNILFTWESFIAISKNKGDRSQNPERHTAQGSGRKGKILSSIALCLTPYLNSQFAIRNSKLPPYALCFFYFLS